MEFNINPDCRKLIKEGKCKADCCGIIPFDNRIFQQIKSKAYTKDYQIQKFNYHGVSYSLPITEQHRCIFLNTDDYSCVIYNSPRKPELCKIYGTLPNEPLAACPHINENKIDTICNSVDKNILDKIRYSKITKKEFACERS